MHLDTSLVTLVLIPVQGLLTETYRWPSSVFSSRNDPVITWELSHFARRNATLLEITAIDTALAGALVISDTYTLLRGTCGKLPRTSRVVRLLLAGELPSIRSGTLV